MKKKMGTVAVVALVASPALAQEYPGERSSELSSRSQERLAPLDSYPSEAFGDGWQYTMFHASKFQPAGGGTQGADSIMGYMTPHQLGETDYWAPLDLPNGAVIDRVFAPAFDSDPGGYLYLAVDVYEAAVQSAGEVMIYPIGSTSYSDVPGYTIFDRWLDPPVVIREWADVTGDGISNPLGFTLQLGCYESEYSGLRFFGAAVRWRRTVSAPPSVPTFGDVPTSSSIFRFVEALADAGITGGCGGGNYCPNQPVTRGQMAVFLSTALGLHWPD